MYPLLILSILGLAIIIERWIVFGIQKTSSLQIDELLSFLLEYYSYIPAQKNRFLSRNHLTIKDKIKDYQSTLVFFMTQLELYQNNLPLYCPIWKWLDFQNIKIKMEQNKKIKDLRLAVLESLDRNIGLLSNNQINKTDAELIIQSIIESAEKGLIVFSKELARERLFVPNIFNQNFSLLVEFKERQNFTEEQVHRILYDLERFEKITEIEANAKIHILQNNMNTLSSIGNLAPLIGFLGTISGMIEAFANIAGAEKITPSIVASGIYEALLTTEYGLIISIVIVFFLVLFENKLGLFTQKVEQISNSFMEIILTKYRIKKDHH